MPRPQPSISNQPEVASDVDARFDQRMNKVMEAVDCYHGFLLHELHSMTRNWHDAQDLLQKLWRHVLLHFPDKHITSPGILRRKAYQIFVDEYRSRARKHEFTTDNVPEVATMPCVQEPHSESEEMALKQKFFSEFPDLQITEVQKDCLWLHARFGHTYQEVADKLGLSKSTVGDWINLARQEIQEQLSA